MINFKKYIPTRLGTLVLLLAFSLASATIFFNYNYEELSLPDLGRALKKFSLKPIKPVSSLPQGLKQFASQEDFEAYLQESSGLNYASNFGGLGRDVMSLEQMPAPSPLAGKGAGEASRVSETTVQVAGIDEPDIVKTDGQEIYFSREWYGWRGGPAPIPMIESAPLGEQKTIAPEYQSKTSLIKAFPPVDLKVDSEIKKNGNLLLAKNVLVIFSGQEIFGFDVSDPKNPKEKWSFQLNDNVFLVASRLKEAKIYLVTQTQVNSFRPCPMEMTKAGTARLTIRCQDIYYPVRPVPVDSAFTTIVLDAESGRAEKNISFVGSAGASIIYMSAESIYVAYPYAEDFIKIYFDFISEKAKDLYPALVFEKLEKLMSYDISLQAKRMELDVIISNYRNSLDADQGLKLDNELANRMQDYMKTRQRDLQKTGIVKIKLDGLGVSALGNVPGNLLNQFSLDEYRGNLRVAVTIGQQWWGWGFDSRSGETANDIYILDKDLKTIGSIKDLGLTERIYSVRFVKDRGYLVTFRQIDPFYVLDLSSPENPVMKGELKIPGYSSYLEPVGDHKVLGIGQEDWKVKVSLFDVSSASNPKELAKYVLDEGWSEVLSNHHAFLLDSKHQIFFLPGGKGGYVFSYQNDELKLEKAVSNIIAKRAIYLNDYLYIIGADKIVVLNEFDWTRAAELNL